MKSRESRNKLDSAVPKSAGTENLSEDEKKALDLSAEAEHETGTRREALHEKIRKKMHSPAHRKVTRG